MKYLMKSKIFFEKKSYIKTFENIEEEVSTFGLKIGDHVRLKEKYRSITHGRTDGIYKITNIFLSYDPEVKYEIYFVDLIDMVTKERYNRKAYKLEKVEDWEIAAIKYNL